MPYVIRPKQRKTLVSAVVSAALLAVLVLPAAASAACPTTPVSKPFQRFGDYADYSLVQNGHFESGTAGWSLNGASVAYENESYKVRSASDTKSLRIESHGKAISPTFCVGEEHPHFRFFARRANGTWGVLYAWVRWTDDDGRVREMMSGSPSGDVFRWWTPSNPLVLGSALPLAEHGGTMQVQLVFDPDNWGGDWLIDDVYIDPYRR
jgi:hypothetical protein